MCTTIARADCFSLIRARTCNAQYRSAEVDEVISLALVKDGEHQECGNEDISADVPVGASAPDRPQMQLVQGNVCRQSRARDRKLHCDGMYRREARTDRQREDETHQEKEGN